MKKIKILLVSHAFVNDRFRSAVLDELVKFADLEVKVLAPLKASMTNNRVINLSVNNSEGYEVIPSKTYFYLAGKQTFIIYDKTLMQTIMRWKPDIIDIFDETPWSLCITQVIRLCKKYSPKTKIIFFSDNNIKRNWNGKRFFYRIFERYNCSNASRIYVPIKGGAYERLTRENGYKGKFSYISSAVDIKKFRRPIWKNIAKLRKKIGLKKGDVLLGVIGGLGRYKGIFFKGTIPALDALAKLPSNYKLMLTGKNGEVERNDVINYAKSKGIGKERIIIPGFVDENDIASYYSAIDIMLAMSVPRKDWAEPFGRMLIEGMACKVSIIGSKCGAIPLVIGNNNFICPVNDSDCLIKKIRYVLSNRKKIREIVERNYKRVLSEFSTTAMARKRRELYISVLNEK